MRTFRIAYGEAVTINIGSLRDRTTGLFVTPTWVAGDVKVMADAGNAFENADDPTPGLVGSSILLDVSAAEAACPAALGGIRLYQIIDQAGAAWVDEEIQILTEDHPLAFDTKGCVLQDTVNAAGQTTTNIRLSGNPGLTLRTGFFFRVVSGTGSGQSGYIKTYTAGATFDVVPYVALDTALDGTSVVKFYEDAKRGPVHLVDKESAVDLSTAETGSVITAGETALANFGAATAAALASLDAKVPNFVTNPPGIKKNTALPNFQFPMYDTNGDPATGKTVTVQLSKDAAAFAGAAGAVAEIASGWYQIDFAAADLNADTIAFKATATGCKPTQATIVTEP